MSTQAKRRLMRDFKRMEQDPTEGVYACPLPNNVLKWDAVIEGCVATNKKIRKNPQKTKKKPKNIFRFLPLEPRPMDTIWESAQLKLTLNFSEDYPNKPPEVVFISKVFHPNGKN